MKLITYFWFYWRIIIYYYLNGLILLILLLLPYEQFVIILILLIISEKLHKIIYIFFYTAPRYPSPNWTLISSLVQDQNAAQGCPNANWASNLESPAQPHIWYPYFVPPS